jgi:leucyl aminopeptidase (aminopeptidase T)
MKINLSNNQIIEISLGAKESNIKINNKVFTEKISGLNVAIVGDKYDEKFKDSFIRNIYQRCIGVGGSKYKMCLDYSFEV